MAQSLDLRGQPFGKWRVIHKGEQTPHGQFWVCYCICNPAITVELVEEALVEEWTRSCGCDYVRSDGRRPALPVCNWVGRQVGKRLVLQMFSTKNNLCYLCRCLCGAEARVKASHLKANESIQCRRCQSRDILQSRWYHETLFVGKVVEPVPHRRKLRYECHFADGSTHIVSGDNIRNGTTKGIGQHQNWGKVVKNYDVIKALWNRGFRSRRIAGELGVHSSAIYAFLKRHPEISALSASLSHDDTSMHIVRVNQTPLGSNIDGLMALVSQGLSIRDIAKKMGVSHAAVHGYLKRHPELAALAASLPPDEELLSEVS